MFSESVTKSFSLATSTTFTQTRQKYRQRNETEVQYKVVINPELSNARTHDAKLVLSFTTSRNIGTQAVPLPISSRAPPPISSVTEHALTAKRCALVKQEYEVGQ